MEERIFEYLARHYERLSVRHQEELLSSIIERLVEKDILGKQIALDIIKGLEEEEHYSMNQILAHLDMLDLDDRI